MKPFLAFGWEEFILAAQSKLKSCYEIAQAALPIMQRKRAGRFVFMGSAWARYPNLPVLSSLAPAFGAMNSLVKALAKEFGPDGITINAVLPGMVETELSLQMPPEVRQQVAALTPLGRIATPEDVARVIAFLASDASGFVTGVCLPVSGGLTMD